MRKLTFLILGVLFLAACQKEDNENVDLPDVVITMKAVAETEGINLHLWDSQGNEGTPFITTTAYGGNKIVWQLSEDSNINKIVAIYKKEDSPEIFVVLPHRIAPGVWEAEVADDAMGNMEYNIDFEYMDGSIVSIDPYIKVPLPTVR